MTSTLKTVIAAAFGVALASSAQALSLQDTLSTWLETPALTRVQLAAWVASNPSLRDGRPEIVSVDLAGCMDELAAASLSPRTTVANAAITCVKFMYPRPGEPLASVQSKDRTGTPVGARW